MTESKNSEPLERRPLLEGQGRSKSNENRSMIHRSTFTKYLNTFTLTLVYLTGIATFFVLISDHLCMKTYFSDNSLLPGLVQREYAHSIDVETHLQMMKKLTPPTDQKQPNERKSDKINSYITTVFQSFGLKTYNQKFHYDQGKFYSESVRDDENWRMSGTNIYTIIRSDRSVTSETLILSVPYRASGYKTTLPSVALAMSLANYFSTRNYWAKDIVIMISDYNMYGISAWLDAYYDVRRNLNSTDHPLLQYEPLYERSGPILAAINLELHADTLEHIDIQIEGLNGQLPNLDLFNLVVEMAARETITPMFHGHSMPFDLSSEELYMLHLGTVLSMMRSQASMWPRAAHGLFQKFAIQSLTLEGFEFRGSSSDADRHSLLPANTLSVARLIEGVFRSLNNLIERFNRSYYFYLLASVRRFTSIGYYMIAFGMMTIPLLLRAITLHTEGLRCVHFSLWRAALECASCHLHGLVLLTLPALVLKFSDHFNLASITGQSLSVARLISLISITYSILIPMTRIILPSARSSEKSSVDQRQSYLMVACLNLALYLSLISLINISLAIILSFALVPIVLTLKPRQKSISRIANRAIIMTIHPIVLSLIITFASNYVLQSLSHTLKSYNLIQEFSSSANLVYESIGQFAEQWYVFGNWAHLLLGPLLFPIWLQLWSVP